MDADGSRLQTIVDPSVNSVRANRDRYPVGMMTYFDISPDGSQIVYSTCRYPDSDRLPSSELRFWEFSYEIVVSNIDGTNTRRITNNNHFDNFPVWSPDGSQIAFISDLDPDHDALNTGGRLMVYTLETGELEDITPWDSRIVAPHPPAWSPDGGYIAFLSYDGDIEYDEKGWPRDPPGAYTLDLDIGWESVISESAFSEPSWSPDGSRIALAAPLAKGAGLFTFDPDGSDPVFVAYIADRVNHRTWLNRVYWSPDGSRIMFTGSAYSDPYDPYAFESWGQPYTFDADKRCRGKCVASVDDAFVSTVSGLRFPSWIDDLRGDFVRDPLIPEPLSWSPDGSRIAVLSRTTRPKTGDAILYVMNRDGKDVRVLVRRDENSDLIAWKSEPVDLDSCSNGVVVPDPEENPGLVEDCRTLLSVMDTLGGSVSLELSHGWRTDRPIAEWGGASRFDGSYFGVVVRGDPPRVRYLVLPGIFTFHGPPIHTLFGRIPPELGNLSELRELDLSVNELTGPIPPELGMLSNLEILDLGDNYLRGSIPAELGNLQNLEKVSLHGFFGRNQFTGCVPVELPDIWVRASGLEWCPSVSNGKEAE